MENLQDKLIQDLKKSMREKETAKVETLRMLLAAIKNKKIEIIGNADKELSDDQILPVIKLEIKKRKDAIEAYEAGGRQDLADKEKGEIKILSGYMPEEMAETEIEEVVRQTAQETGVDSMQGFGRLMGQVMAKLKNKADGNTVSAVVKKVLNS